MNGLPPTTPPAREHTPRAAIREVLLTTLDTGASALARDLATAAKISEKDVAPHLEHLVRSLPADGLRIEVLSAKCLACGFVFRDRPRFTTPSQCPTCASERIAPPSFRLARGPIKQRPARRERPDGDDDD